ncbi:flagellar export protein FliJ [Phycisphaerales bacterium AB-hyl4]|uniref:Flagellar FliJ protein n=1 Tax=Natronomicrosphaera hydrolytica TaxID=3242702 RepID=A0ABV4U746_9BACT
MAGFRFKFENVLEHRRTIEDQAQRELARHLRARMILQGQLEQMQTTIRQSKTDLADALVGRVDLDRVSSFAQFSGHSSVRARQIVEHLAKMEKQITAARERLLDATRQRKAMELLRDRHERDWKREHKRREAILMDELATQQYLRTTMIGGRL